MTTSYTNVTKVTDTTWTYVTQSGTMEAYFELPEPLGGITWTDVDKRTGSLFTNLTNLLAIQAFGHFSLEPTTVDSDGLEEVSEYTDAEHLLGIQAFGHLLDLVTGADEIWADVTKDTL